MSDDDGVRITTLGPLAVDGRPVRGARLAAVIGELVDARGRTVSTGALVGAIWQGVPPEDAAGALQALVARARRLGLPVLAAPGGYRVPADEVQIDAVTVRSLMSRGRAALHGGDVGVARGCADEARGLFPERPELADPGAARLFGDVVALRAETALAGGGSFDEEDLRRLAARVPPDEPAAALLVRVLAAQGRDAEALDLAEQVRAELADRYGTDPSPVLAEAHVALLRGQLAAVRPEWTGRLPAAWRRPGTPLVGRDPDLAAVGQALLESPLVTVVATGGAGKTRLAAEIARSLSGSRPVRVVELAGVRSPGEVLPAVLAVLGGAATASGGGLSLERRVLSPEERLRAVGSELEGLLVLDNCEHVLAAAATVVADLLAVASPAVGVLATSRAPLGLVGEVVHRLPALPDDEALALLDARVRAGGAVPGWGREPALALCHRLDNLPLALELAAARLRHMPIEDVLAGLSDRFALLDDALRGLPERHASLWAMVDWSRALLEPDEQELLQRLAIIPAPFTAELAAAAAGGAQVRRGLAILVEQSLLRLADGRYRMLETVREYGETRLDAAGGREQAMAGLVGWARPRAVAVAADFIGPGQVAALAACRVEQDNLMAALRWSQDHDDEPGLVDVAAALFHLWTVQGLHREVSAWARQLLHVDDPIARRRSAILHGRATGRPLPHADRLARMCLLIGINAGSTGSGRLNVLARRALRTLLAERPGDVSPRIAALAAVLPGLEQADPGQSRADAAILIAHPDPYVQAMGHFLRAVLTENAGLEQDEAGDAELAYRRFEALGDHWGMGIAAQAGGHSAGPGPGPLTDEWLRRSERHLALVGAARDARSTRVLLDTQLALAGDAEAERRLRELAGSDHVDENDACQADLGLAELAWRRGRPDEAVAHADALVRVIAEARAPGPAQPRAAFRIAVAVIHLWVADARPAPGTTAGADARVADALRQARTEVLTAHHRPLLGACALGGAELAAFRGDAVTARELWALGTRVGANVSRFFPQGRGDRLAAALGDREKLLAEARALPATVVDSRITALMDDLLA